MRIDLVGLALSSLMSLGIGVLVSRHFSARKRLSWLARQRKVLDPISGNFPDGVEIIFDGRKVDRLSEWKIGVWNSGNRTIDYRDFLNENGLSFNFSGCEVLKVSPPVQTREILKATVRQTINSIHLNAVVFDVGDAVAFSVYTSSPMEGDPQDVKLTVSGEISGIPKGALESQPPPRNKRTTIKIFASAGLTYLIFSAFMFWGLYEVLTESDPRAMWSLDNFIQAIRLSGLKAAGFPVLLCLIGGVFFGLASLVSLYAVVRVWLRKVPDVISDNLSQPVPLIRAILDAKKHAQEEAKYV